MDESPPNSQGKRHMNVDRLGEGTHTLENEMKGENIGCTGAHTHARLEKEHSVEWRLSSGLMCRQWGLRSEFSPSSFPFHPGRQCTQAWHSGGHLGAKDTDLNKQGTGMMAQGKSL